MSVIVDANVAVETFCSETSDFSLIFRALRNGDARLSYGGHLIEEYGAMHKVLRIVHVLDQAGKATLVSRDQVDKETKVLKNSSACQSNDEHIIALARIGGARLLCSRDTTLHQDFKDKTLISNPRGKIYQCADHSSLIQKLGK